VLIKAVNRNKPKMLSGLDQNGTWPGTGAVHSPVADGAPPVEKHDPTPGAIGAMNEVTPLPAQKGKPTVKDADEAAGKG